MRLDLLSPRFSFEDGNASLFRITDAEALVPTILNGTIAQNALLIPAAMAAGDYAMQMRCRTIVRTTGTRDRATVLHTPIQSQRRRGAGRYRDRSDSSLGPFRVRLSKAADADEDVVGIASVGHTIEVSLRPGGEAVFLLAPGGHTVYVAGRRDSAQHLEVTNDVDDLGWSTSVHDCYLSRSMLALRAAFSRW